LQNILTTVYGLPSGFFHQDESEATTDCFDQPFVKTHLLPHQLPNEYATVPAIYIVREGRAAIASMAHYRKDTLAPDSELNQNLTETIIAARGSHFGGWSVHASAWMKRAALIIRFEDLIKDPLGEVEKIRQIYPDLPQPLDRALPKLKGKKTPEWELQLPADLKTMYWALHGQISERLGYFEHGQHKDLPALAPWAKNNKPEEPRPKVLLAASKLSDVHIDGTKRYIDTLLKGFSILKHTQSLPVDIYIQDHGLVAFDGYSNYVAERKWGARAIRFILTLPKRFKEDLPFPVFQFFWKVARKLGIIGLMSRCMEWRRKRQINKHNFDLIHYTTPILDKQYSAKVLTTIHDIVFELHPQFQPDVNVAFHQKALRKLIRKDTHFLTVSKHTEKDLLSFYDLPQHASTMIYEAIDHERFFPVLYQHEKSRILSKYDLEEDRYFLFVSTLEPRKNIGNTLKAFRKFQEQHADLGIKFVLGGAYGWMMEDLELPDNVIRTGFIPDQDLNVIMGGATALCYVSYYEGFGLPPLEAMRCKTVPIYGRNSSMVELIGDYGLSADPDNVEEISQQMMLIATDKALRKRMEEAAYQRSWEFTIEKTCRETLDLYLKTINN
jgi:glycosyltransferase involved in cell wall biosynthesis